MFWDRRSEETDFDQYEGKKFGRVYTRDEAKGVEFARLGVERCGFRVRGLRNGTSENWERGGGS